MKNNNPNKNIRCAFNGFDANGKQILQKNYSLSRKKVTKQKQVHNNIFIKDAKKVHECLVHMFYNNIRTWLNICQGSFAPSRTV